MAFFKEELMKVKAFVFDIDGVLADNSHRIPFIENNGAQKKDWAAYYAGLPDDTPIEPMMDTLHELSDYGHRIVFCTGRPERYRQATIDWFIKHGYPEVTLHDMHMRPDGSFVSNPQQKRVWIARIEERWGKIDMVFEDDPRSVEMWREHAKIVCEVHRKNMLTSKENSVEYTL